jgi:hypothetical protein
MEVHRREFPTIMLDNDEIFINKIVGVVESVDELSSMEITKTGHSYNFRIAPSIPKYLEPILYEVLKFNNMFGIHLDLGKSMKVSSTVNFEITLDKAN